MKEMSGIDRYKAALAPLLEREAISRQLAERVPTGSAFFGLVGLTPEADELSLLPELFLVRPVSNPPDWEHLVWASAPGDWRCMSIGRDVSRITSELVCTHDPESAERDYTSLTFELAYHMAVLLRLVGAQDLHIPAAASASWDVIAARKRDVVFSPLDPIAPMCGASRTTLLLTEDAQWISDHFDVALELRNFATSRRFGLAFGVAHDWNRTPNPRVALANIWVGIEALFGDQQDKPVTRRLVGRLVEWMDDPSEETVTALYQRRCDAVHGRWLDDSALQQPIEDSWQLLRRALILAIERGSVPLSDWSGAQGV